MSDAQPHGFKGPSQGHKSVNSLQQHAAAGIYQHLHKQVCQPGDVRARMVFI